MPRPIFRKKAQLVELKETVSTESNLSSALSAVDIESRLREKRSAAYLDLFNKLDSGEKVISKAQTQQLIDAVKAEFPELPDSAMPLGIVAACYLGHPYEVHSIDMERCEIRHYRVSEPLPTMLEQARNIALHPSYAYIEVYKDCLRAIDKHGEVAVVK